MARLASRSRSAALGLERAMACVRLASHRSVRWGVARAAALAIAQTGAGRRAKPCLSAAQVRGGRRLFDPRAADGFAAPAAPERAARLAHL